MLWNKDFCTTEGELFLCVGENRWERSLREDSVLGRRNHCATKKSQFCVEKLQSAVGIMTQSGRILVVV